MILIGFFAVLATVSEVIHASNTESKVTTITEISYSNREMSIKTLSKSLNDLMKDKQDIFNILPLVPIEEKIMDGSVHDKDNADFNDTSSDNKGCDREEIKKSVKVIEDKVGKNSNTESVIKSKTSDNKDAINVEKTIYKDKVEINNLKEEESPKVNAYDQLKDDVNIQPQSKEEQNKESTLNDNQNYHNSIIKENTKENNVNTVSEEEAVNDNKEVENTIPIVTDLPKDSTKEESKQSEATNDENEIILTQTLNDKPRTHIEETHKETHNEGYMEEPLNKEVIKRNVSEDNANNEVREVKEGDLNNKENPTEQTTTKENEKQTEIVKYNTPTTESYKKKNEKRFEIHEDTRSRYCKQKSFEYRRYQNFNYGRYLKNRL